MGRLEAILVSKLTSLFRDGLIDFGSMVLFMGETLQIAFRKGIKAGDVLDQMYRVGVQSLGITVATGLFVGGIMVIQIFLELRDFGAQGFLGGLTTSTTLRDVGPVLIGFLLSGKVGAQTSAEIASMKVTDQWSVLRCLGTDPIEYLVVPRLVAVTASSVALMIIGLMMTTVGGALVADLQLGISPANFVHRIGLLVDGWSLGTGVVKSIFFGALISWISCYRGYRAEGGAAGVGATVRTSAVQCLLSIIIADHILSSIMTAIRSAVGG